MTTVTITKSTALAVLPLLKAGAAEKQRLANTPGDKWRRERDRDEAAALTAALDDLTSAIEGGDRRDDNAMCEVMK